MAKPLRIGILASTNGTILPDIVAGVMPETEFVVLVTNVPGCGAVAKAREADIPVEELAADGLPRSEWERECVRILREHAVDLVILVGFMRILSSEFVRAFPQRILNVHPSLLPKHAGQANDAVHAAVLAAGESETGATIHLVTEAVDAGPILAQESIPVLPDDTPHTLKTRVQELEAELYPQAIMTVREQIERSDTASHQG